MDMNDLELRTLKAHQHKRQLSRAHTDFDPRLWCEAAAIHTLMLVIALLLIPVTFLGWLLEKFAKAMEAP